MTSQGEQIACRYELLEPFGASSGSWTSWLAKDLKFGERVHLRLGGGLDAPERERVAWATRMTRRLSRTKGVLRVLDWGDDGPVVFQVLDLIPAGRPLELIEGPAHERLRHLVAAAEIVSDIHRQGVVHLDLGPGRFLVHGQDVHLTAFEAARSREDTDPPPLPAPLEPNFAAPERLAGARRFDSRTDVYSIGAMLHVVALRRAPREPGTFVPSDPVLRRLAEVARRATDPSPTSRPPLPDVVSELRRAVTALAGKRQGTARRGLPALPSEGFLGWEELRRVAQSCGPDAVVEALGHHPLLLVRRERPIKGKTHLLGRCAAVRARGPERSGTIVLGRAPEVDIRVELSTVSSRHLLLVKEPRGWSISDVSSNGTTVGSVILRRGVTRAIDDRDTIGLSNHVWLQLLLPASVATLLDPTAEPVAFDVEEGAAIPPPSPDPLGVSSFVGRIVGTELVEFLQLIELNQRTGILVVSAGTDQGRVDICEGRVVEARLGANTDVAALRALLAIRKGTFAFTACQVEQGTTNIPIAHVLLDAARQSDEGGR